MKGLRNKVILSGIVLLFAFIATIGSTYAWFTVSSSTQIESMTLNVTAADNLLLRARTVATNDENLLFLQDAGNYSTFITLEELILAGYLFDSYSGTPGEASFEGIGPWRLQPSTVLGDHVDGDLLQYLPQVTSRDYSPATENDNNGQYIKLEFWLLSQSEEPQTIQLNNFFIDSEDSGLGNFGDQQQVEDSVRLAIWLDDTIHGGATAQGPGETFIFGNDNDYDFAFLLGDTGYDSDTTANNVAPTNVADFPVNTSAVAPYNHVDPVDPVTNLYTVNFNIPTLITVMIYIEGWDAHASNDIILAAFNVNFGFKYEE